MSIARPRSGACRANAPSLQQSLRQLEQRISSGSEHRQRHAQEYHAPNYAISLVVLITKLAPYLTSKRRAQTRHAINDTMPLDFLPANFPRYLTIPPTTGRSASAHHQGTPCIDMRQCSVPVVSAIMLDLHGCRVPSSGYAVLTKHNAASLQLSGCHCWVKDLLTCRGQKVPAITTNTR